IKFSIEHFRYTFEVIKKNRDIADDLVKSQLKSIWLFIISISTEFRKPDNITFEERKNLDKQASSFSDFDFSNFNLGDISNQHTDEPAENKWTYSKKFKELYYGRLSEQYVFHPEVYDLITSSKIIVESDFLENLEK